MRPTVGTLAPVMVHILSTKSSVFPVALVAAKVQEPAEPDLSVWEDKGRSGDLGFCDIEVSQSDEHLDRSTAIDVCNAVEEKKTKPIRTHRGRQGFQ